jgi:hypothetical protein
MLKNISELRSDENSSAEFFALEEKAQIMSVFSSSKY